jgi:hypothetical protein
MVTVLSAMESEGLIVKALLEDNNIPAIVKGSVDLPSPYRFGGCEVLVPEEYEAEARRIIFKAMAAGAAAADEGEAETEN